MPQPQRKSKALAGKRIRLYENILATPGLAFLDLARSNALASGEAQNHLYRLEDAGLVQSIKSGRFRRYFPTGLPRGQKQHIAALRTPILGDVYRLILAKPGIVLIELMRHFHSTHQNVAYHAQMLERLELVRRIPRGRFTEHWPVRPGVV